MCEQTTIIDLLRRHYLLRLIKPHVLISLYSWCRWSNNMYLTCVNKMMDYKEQVKVKPQPLSTATSRKSALLIHVHVVSPMISKLVPSPLWTNLYKTIKWHRSKIVHTCWRQEKHNYKRSVDKWQGVCLYFDTIQTQTLSARFKLNTQTYRLFPVNVIKTWMW